MSHSVNIGRKWKTLIGLHALALVILAVSVIVVHRKDANTWTHSHTSAFNYIKLIQSGVEAYEQDVGQLPTTEQGLTALLSPPPDLPKPATWGGPYIRDRSFDDPWRNPYQYISPGKNGHSFTIWSYGPDGIDNTGDEIGSYMDRFPPNSFRFRCVWFDSP